ncbi:MAG: chorismate synthase [Candidatus Riflebacteria bacterium]|nr:chorismate synthase [Candidatus Riflebacteria bacterium]
MAGNTFGQLFRVTTFGESHGELIGVVIDGCPAGLAVDLGFVQSELDRRRPGQSKLTTSRNELDRVRFVSGLFEGRTTGTPLTALIINEDQRPDDYSHNGDAYRPSHADFTYEKKYGVRDHFGGGRSSARETAARVAAGAVAKLLLGEFNVAIRAYVSQVGRISMPHDAMLADKLFADKQFMDAFSETNITRCPDPGTAAKIIEFIEALKKDGDTTGGVVNGIIRGCPVGLGDPVFDKLHADLGKAMLSINAVKGFEYGSGFSGVSLRGSEHNDLFVRVGERTETSTNHSGGIQGGISNGMDIDFRVAFKPVATLLKSQTTLDRQGQTTVLPGRGRHDSCVVPRAVPIVEAMAAITIADHFLRNRGARL